MTTSLTPVEAARESARAVHDLPATFMFDMATYEAAGALGYEGTAFYFAGRGGVLGDVDAETVAKAFVFFPSETVRTNWESSADVESRSESARRFAGAAHAWAIEHLPDGAIDYARLADLAGRVENAGDPSGAPVFAGWRDLPEPTDERALALHRLNALRELRAARHGVAVHRVGLEPVQAFMVKSPYMAAIFGWPEPEGGPDEATREHWNRAEELTNELFGQDLSLLDSDELDEFCLLAESARSAAL